LLGSAQVLLNTRADGAPALILATPPRPLGAGSAHPARADVEAGVFGALRAAIAADADRCGPLPEATVVIDLEAAAFDRPDLTPTLRAVANLLADSRP
jgi:hypothetical protein